MPLKKQRAETARIMRMLNRKECPRPGAGRKTSFKDRKKEATRMACRDKKEEDGE